MEKGYRNGKIYYYRREISWMEKKRLREKFCSDFLRHLLKIRKIMIETNQKYIILYQTLFEVFYTY